MEGFNTDVKHYCSFEQDTKRTYGPMMTVIKKLFWSFHLILNNGLIHVLVSSPAARGSISDHNKNMMLPTNTRWPTDHTCIIISNKLKNLNPKGRTQLPTKAKS